jgi:hypothetical protein
MAVRSLTKRTVETPSGQIAYAEAGEGPVALFAHGVLLNKHLWLAKTLPGAKPPVELTGARLFFPKNIPRA